METEPTGFQCGDDNFMSTITTLRGDAMHIDVVDTHGANGFCDGHERSFTLLANKVPASASDTHYVLQRVRANVKSPRPPHGNGLYNRPHLIVGLDRYNSISFWVHFSDSEVPSPNLELQTRRNQQSGHSRIDRTHPEHRYHRRRGGMPDPRCLQKTLVRQVDAR